jgi:Ca2+-binding EF-hand superfamily protein
MKRMQHIFTGLITIAFIGLSGCATTDKFSYDTWDKDDDGTMTTEEFTQVFKTYYASEWKEGQQMEANQLSKEQFLKSSFNFWDANDDSNIAHDEWEALNDFYFNKYGFEKFEKIDEDNNGQLSYLEYKDEIEDNGLFNGWDQNENSMVSESELAQGVFNAYDFDDTGYLEKGEFNTFASFYAER